MLAFEPEVAPELAERPVPTFCDAAKELNDRIPRHVHGFGKTGLYRQHSLLVTPNEVYSVSVFFLRNRYFPVFYSLI